METKPVKKRTARSSKKMKKKMVRPAAFAAASVVLSAVLLLIPSNNSKTLARDVSFDERANVSQICELASLRCFYHNVAEMEKQPNGLFQFGLAKYGYKKMWLEYSGIVEIGIHADEVVIKKPDADGTVQVYVPDAVILNSTADKDSLSLPITETGWFTNIKTEDVTLAFSEAQKNMRLQAENDTRLLKRATNNAKKLIEQYIINIGNEMGQSYTVKWLNAPPND